MQKTYSKQTAKFLSAIGENMPDLTGRQMQMWIQNPQILQKVLNQLDQQPITGLHPSPIQEWKTITVGGKTNQQLIEEMKRLGVNLNETMMKHCPEILTPHKARLAIVTAEHLGWVKEPTMEEFIQGLASCNLSYHAAVGPYLRLTHLEQVENDDDYLYVAMEPLPSNQKGTLSFWMLDRYNGRLTLVEDGSDEGWARNVPAMVVIMGHLEPMTD